MKQFFWAIFVVMNLIFGCLYCWGADNNRYVCAWLWWIVPTLNVIVYGIFEKVITEDNNEYLY